MKTFHTLLTFLFPYFLTVTAFAQNNGLLWAKHIGGTGFDRPASLSIALDGSIYMGGVTYSTDVSKHPSLGNGDGLVVKLSPSGDTLWTRYIGGSDPDNIGGVTAMPDSGVVAVGVSYNPGETPDLQEDGLIVRFDKNGNVKWKKLISGTYYKDGMEQLFDVKATPDGGFVVAGVTSNFWIFGLNLADTTTGAADGWVIKFDGDGNKQWYTRVFSTEKIGGNPIDQIYNELVSVQVLSHNQGYIAIGNTGHYAVLSSTEFFLAKIDINGKLIWKKKYGSDLQDQAFKVIELPNGNYMMGGWVNGASKDVTGTISGKHDMWYAVTDTAGALLSEQIYGGPEVDEIHDMVTNGDSDVVITGRFSFESTALLSSDGAVMNVSTDMSSFAPQIIRFDGNNNDVGYAIAHDTVTDEFVVAFSSTSSSGFFPDNFGGEDIWVFRLKQPIGLGIRELSDRHPLNLYPNPAQNQLIVHSRKNGEATVSVYSLAGQKILSQNCVTDGSFSMDVSGLADGMYILEYQNKKEVYREKFVKRN